MEEKKLAKWWLKLNKWEVPEDLQIAVHNDGKDHIRGAFAIVNKLISLKEVKKYKD